MTAEEPQPLSPDAPGASDALSASSPHTPGTSVPDAPGASEVDARVPRRWVRGVARCWMR